MSARFGMPGGAARAEASRLSLRRSKAGRPGGTSAARIASSPLAVLKAPATVLPITVVSLEEPLLAFPDGFDAVRRRRHDDRPGDLPGQLVWHTRGGDVRRAFFSSSGGSWEALRQRLPLDFLGFVGNEDIGPEDGREGDRAPSNILTLRAVRNTSTCLHDQPPLTSVYRGEPWRGNCPPRSRESRPSSWKGRCRARGLAPMSRDPGSM